MPELVTPTTAVHGSFVEAMDEFAAEGRGSSADDSMVGREIRERSAGWQDPAVVARHVEGVIAEALAGSPDASVVGGGVRERSAGWQDPAVFARYVEGVIAESLPDTPRPEGFVP